MCTPDLTVVLFESASQYGRYLVVTAKTDSLGSLVEPRSIRKSPKSRFFQNSKFPPRHDVYEPIPIHRCDALGTSESCKNRPSTSPHEIPRFHFPLLIGHNPILLVSVNNLSLK